MLYFGGTDEPCAQAYLMSIGQLGVKENIKHAKVIFEKVSKDLGIPPTRMYITFDDKPSAEVGHNGTTFYEIFGG
jgi:phenylpyruvate tautomerase